MDVLTTPLQIRRQLGEDYYYIRRKFDRHKEDRAKTKDIAEAAYGKAEECAICGQKGHVAGRRPDWAHVVGLQECGETEPANLLPLCWRPDRKGCHQLYDGAPSATPAEVFEAQKRWREGGFWPELRHEMEERSRKFFSQAEQPPNTDREALARLMAASWWERARTLCRLKLSKTLGESDRFWWQTKLVEVGRRSGALGELEAAEQEWAKLEQIAPSPQLASFFYEGAYIRLLLGQHEKAHQLFSQSVSALQLTDETAGIGASSLGLIVQTLVAIHGSAAPWEQVMDLARQAREACLGGGNDIARRWIDNWNWHMVRIELVRGRQDVCNDAWEEAERQSLTLTNRAKWDPLGFGIKRITSGLVLTRLAASASGEESNRLLGLALRHLSRAMVLKVGRTSLQPEMVRDLLFALAECLRMRGDRDRSTRVASVAARVRDGSSWLNPYRD